MNPWLVRRAAGCTTLNGAGSSQLTWQALAGIAYSFSWGEVKRVCRHLSYGEDAGKLMQDFESSGPAFGATLRF
jgi:hypothetical protein